MDLRIEDMLFSAVLRWFSAYEKAGLRIRNRRDTQSISVLDVRISLRAGIFLSHYKI
jgi:hypothetical protein